MDTVYVLCCRDGMRVEVLGFHLDESIVRAEADLRNSGNWYSHFYVSEVPPLD